MMLEGEEEVVVVVDGEREMHLAETSLLCTSPSIFKNVYVLKLIHLVPRSFPYSNPGSFAYQIPFLCHKPKQWVSYFMPR